MKKIKIAAVFVIVFSLLVVTPYEGTYFITGLSPALGPDSRGDGVEQVQQRLKNWGYYTGDVNGIFDSRTSQAVMDFQKNRGLSATGIAGEDTLVKMGLTKIVQRGAAYAENDGTGDVQLLARAINGEARGEPYEGQVAVGAVILNRTRDPKFPKTIAGVIYQPGAFTAVSDGQINVALDPQSTVVKAARDALNGWDPTNGCIYYWNPATATSSWIWGRQIIAKIGKHYFGK